MKVKAGYKAATVNNDNILLRGASLRNTEFAVGLVVYTGHETKIMQNSIGASAKLSTIEKNMNTKILFILGIEFILIFIGGIL